MTLSLIRCAGVSFAILLSATATQASSYLPGQASTCPGCTFGAHLPFGPSGSLPGVGGSGINAASGGVLDGNRTYIYDLGGWIDGAVSRGDADFAMLVWDMGAAYDTVRLYTHQDHYFGGPTTDPFIVQDLMEYSVWGSNDNMTFLLLSDVIAFDANGGGPGVPTYTFAGTAPSVVYRGGSTAFGITNAYTRDYTFATTFRYYGIRASTISLAAGDADPEIDALAANQGNIDPPVAEPGLATLLLLGAAAMGRRGWRRRRSTAAR
jgi:hypothetical protein